ncbi:hypothetical protein L2E82_28338 [Cichorium intybus]|uniref:Uncharacterized protein n=1 Tax=Cichorium intybus TaxID=13427 RepID=A0ACB9CW56_CICIN|nr:hypothetical protein L2E82_28338 [Cichorium intybus]
MDLTRCLRNLEPNQPRLTHDVFTTGNATVDVVPDGVTVAPQTIPSRFNRCPNQGEISGWLVNGVVVPESRFESITSLIRLRFNPFKTPLVDLSSRKASRFLTSDANTVQIKVVT